MCDTVTHVVIVDDHLIVREGLRLILEASDGFEVVGDASDGQEAIELIRQTQPDIVLMDLQMPGMGGLEAIKYIHNQWPQIAVVILTTYNEDDLMLQGMYAGACGYLLKDTSREHLLDTIRSAARGEVLLQQDVLTRILQRSKSVAPPKPPATVFVLTEREQAVLLGVASGERSKEIAKRLCITERTVKAHLASIFRKLNVDSRSSAVAVAIKNGLLPHQY